MKNITLNYEPDAELVAEMEKELADFTAEMGYNYKGEIPEGIQMLIRFWETSIQRKTECIEVDSWSASGGVETVKQFIRGLREAGITYFVYTGSSTNTIELLYQFTAMGCELGNFTKVTRVYYGGMTESVRGLCITAN